MRGCIEPCFCFSLLTKSLNIAIFFPVSDELEICWHLFSVKSSLNILEVIIYHIWSIANIEVYIKIECHIAAGHSGDGLQGVIIDISIRSPPHGSRSITAPFLSIKSVYWETIPDIRTIFGRDNLRGLSSSHTKS